jgi:hypothetical protein
MNEQYANIPEDGLEITHTIYDQLGDTYTIEGHLSPSSLISYVCSPKGYVGRINWDTSQPDILVIADLIIFDPLNIKRWWARLFPFLYRQPVHYRGRGLGSAMLHYITASPRAMGMAEIRGWITCDDLQVNPYLPVFYRKHGFTVNDDLTFYQVLD